MVATRSPSQAWLTGDAPGDLICYRAFYPAGYQPQFLGALFLLTQEYNWEEIGDATPEEVSDAFKLAYNQTLKGGGCMPPGAMVMWLTDTMPDGWLLCDGSSYAVEDYPDLFAEIGYDFGGSGDNFNVPDMTGLFPFGNDATLNDTGGAKTHTLATSEIPSHVHSVHSHQSLLITIGQGAPVFALAAGQSTATGATGGGGSHNNMPPFRNVNFIIRT